jgi:glycosyltransferase involved in cell wall biosynthesis
MVTDSILPFHRGGKEVRYREIARRLARRAEVHIHTMNWWSGKRTVKDGPVTLHAISPHVPLYARERRSVPQAIVFAIACLRLLTARFDVLEADHMPYLQLFVLRLVASVRRTSLVVTWHECWGPDYWRDYLGTAGLVGWWFERLAMRLPDKIIAASEETAARLRAATGDRTPVIVAPNGVDLHLIDEVTPDADARDVVVVGRMLSHKRLDLLIDALGLLQRQGRPATCRIIGDGPERDALIRRAGERGVRHLIDFRHDVGEAERLYSLLKSARVFAFPSEREGFGIAVLEALACGLPVITTSAPDNVANQLVARAPGSMVCEPTVTAFADGIAAMLASRSAARRPAWLTGFDWDEIAGRVGDVLLEESTEAPSLSQRSVVDYA